MHFTLAFEVPSNGIKQQLFREGKFNLIHLLSILLVHTTNLNSFSVLLKTNFVIKTVSL